MSCHEWMDIHMTSRAAVAAKIIFQKHLPRVQFLSGSRMMRIMIWSLQSWSSTGTHLTWPWTRTPRWTSHSGDTRRTRLNLSSSTSALWEPTSRTRECWTSSPQTSMIEMMDPWPGLVAWGWSWSTWPTPSLRWACPTPPWSGPDLCPWDGTSMVSGGGSWDQTLLRRCVTSSSRMTESGRTLLMSCQQ